MPNKIPRMGEVISKQPGDSEFTRRETHIAKIMLKPQQTFKKSESKVETAIVIALEKDCAKNQTWV